MREIYEFKQRYTLTKKKQGSRTLYMGWVSAYIQLVHNSCISNILSSANPNSALFIPSHDIKIKLINFLHSNSRFILFYFLFFFKNWNVATKKKGKKKNHARCNKMCRPLSQTKILHCPQCMKAKINSSIKGRSYLKHLIFFFFFFWNFFHTCKC